MGAARADRGHPLEFLALFVGSPIILAILRASDEVIAVSGTFTTPMILPAAIPILAVSSLSGIAFLAPIPDVPM